MLGDSLLLEESVRSLCQETKTDGYLFVGESSCADVRLIVFNNDGSRPTMCGNGLSCVVAHIAQVLGRNAISVETDAGVYKGVFDSWDRVVIDMTLPEWNLSLRKLSATLPGLPESLGYVHTGVPHLVTLVPDVSAIDVEFFGRFLRYHKDFQPEGVNVNFAQMFSPQRFQVRTYERGLERESLACGTGAIAVLLVAAHLHGWKDVTLDILTRNATLVKASLRNGRTFLAGPVVRLT